MRRIEGRVRDEVEKENRNEIGELELLLTSLALHKDIGALANGITKGQSLGDAVRRILHSCKEKEIYVSYEKLAKEVIELRTENELMRWQLRKSEISESSLTHLHRRIQHLHCVSDIWKANCLHIGKFMLGEVEDLKRDKERLKERLLREVEVAGEEYGNGIKRVHGIAKVRVGKLKRENKKLKERVCVLEAGMSEIRVRMRSGRLAKE